MAALAGPALAVVLVRRNVDDGRDVAVVRPVDAQHATLARVRAREAEGQVVRLGTGIHPEDHLEVAGESLADPPRVVEDVRVEVPVVCVERLELRAARLDDGRVAVCRSRAGGVGLARRQPPLPFETTHGQRGRRC